MISPLKINTLEELSLFKKYIIHNNGKKKVTFLGLEDYDSLKFKDRKGKEYEISISNLGLDPTTTTDSPMWMEAAVKRNINQEVNNNEVPHYT